MANLKNVGAQSYSFRDFSFEDSLGQLKALGLNAMEFCAVHFQPDAALPEFADIKAKLEAENVVVPCFGVEAYSADKEANRKKFEFARALGVKYLSADPEPEAFDGLDELVEEFQIAIAIHNHGPGARYDKVKDTLDAVAGHHPLIGACVDTGHSIRSDEAPHEVIEQLGERCLTLHLKDWTSGGEEQIIGEGDLELDKTVAALNAVNFDAPVIMEYELSPFGPVADMKKGMQNWLDAVG